MKKNYNNEIFSEFKIVNKIKSPNDLKKLNLIELETLSSEIRRKILEVVSTNGGHLASNLGVVELTIALHRIFNSPNDKIIWDVGHQCYAHKILTGRFNQFNTLRQEKGLSGFTKPIESVHDVAISGHASVSISIASGFATAELIKKTKNKVIAVIGDGALTGGLAFEALNNCLNLNNLIIVLNCNHMSISETVGCFSKILSNSKNKFKKFLNMFLQKLNFKPNIFSEMGYFFLQSIDGHNLSDLLKAFKIAANKNQPTIVQVFTKKGYGYFKAEQNPSIYHSVGCFNLNEGVKLNKPEFNVNCFSNVFGNELCKLAADDEKICAITAAMSDGTGLNNFKKLFPQRFFDVGIAEEHAITFAAGLSSGGMMPVVAIYSTFLQRSFDQIIHDLAISKQHVVLAVDRAGLVSGDGETHQGIFDCSFLTLIPNVSLFAPTSYIELKYMLKVAIYETDGIVAIRYSKGKQIDFLAQCDEFKKGFDKNFIVFGKSKVAILTYGNLTWQAILARKTIMNLNNFEIAVIKLNKLKPIDENLINLLKNYQEIFCFEESIKNGGIGEHIFCKLTELCFLGTFFLTAIDDRFVNNLTIEGALHKLNLDYEGMVKKIISCSKIIR